MFHLFQILCLRFIIMLAKLSPQYKFMFLLQNSDLRENDHIKHLFNQQTEGSWPDNRATQGPTISPKNQPPYSDHHRLPQLWRSITLVFKPL